jgi:hypothetical protein
MSECKFGQFPYPDDCVFQVNLLRQEPLTLENIESKVVVAENEFMIHEVYHDKNLLQIVSLASLRAKLEELQQAATRPDDFLVIAAKGFVSKILGSLEPFLVIYFDENQTENMHNVIVMAHRPRDITQYFAQKNQQVYSFVTIDMLTEAVTELEQYAQGKEQAFFIHNLQDSEKIKDIPNIADEIQSHLKDNPLAQQVYDEALKKALKETKDEDINF